MLVDKQVSPEEDQGKCSQVCNMVLGFFRSGDVISSHFISVIKYFTCSVKEGGNPCPAHPHSALSKGFLPSAGLHRQISVGVGRCM